MWALQKSQLFDSLVLVERYFLWLQVVHGCSCFETSQIWEPTFLCSPHQSCKSQMIRRVPISTLQFGWTVTSLSLAQRPWSRLSESRSWNWFGDGFFQFWHVQVVIKIAEWIVPFVPACCRGHCYQFVGFDWESLYVHYQPTPSSSIKLLSINGEAICHAEALQKASPYIGMKDASGSTCCNLCFSFHV